MQARTATGRAAPPRPFLLVGSLADCRPAYERLQQRVLELSLAQQAAVEAPDASTSSSSADAWRELVPRCRALRETLHSQRELSHFTREVYECAADVCVRAGDWPEALKALQHLVHLIYPALAAQEGSSSASTAAAVGPPGLNGCAAAAGTAAAAAAAAAAPPPAALQAGSIDEEDEEWGAAAAGAAALDDVTFRAALQRREYRRWPEAAAALTLYWAAVQPAGGDRLDLATTLRRLPTTLLATPELHGALRLRAALAAGDWVGFFRRRAAAPPLVQVLAGAATARARERALAALAAAYRNIAAAAACRMLDVDARQLAACLKLLGDKGHAAAQRALGELQQADAPAAADLVFRG